MVIGIDASRANRKHKSGTEWYSYHLIKELAQLDDKNQYILYCDNLLTDLIDLTTEGKSQQFVEFDQDGFQKIKSPHNNFKAKILKWPFNFLWTHGRLSLEMIFNRPDALFVPSHVLPIIHPKKSIVTIHDVGFERDKKLYLQKSLGSKNKNFQKLINFSVRLFTLGKYGANVMDYFTWSTLHSLKRAKKIISVSNFTKNEIKEIYKQKLKSNIFDKIKVIHYGFNNKIFKKIDDYDKISEILEKYDIEPPFIFYLGRMDKRKNVSNLVEAFGLVQKDIKDINLVLTGAADYGYDEIKYIASEYQLENRIVKTGWIGEEDLPYILNAAEAFVYPSLYEGLGTPLIEAMACGVPITASNIDSVIEAAGDSALLFDPLDTNSIAQSLVKIITDRPLTVELIEKGHNQASCYSWTKTARQTLQEIESL
ncbi:MAG: Group 1 glycosyl transferase [Parcubacteria group bacterium GW2011_GWE2_39_37]|nr:MAG: Group 1 glycosyl transferase [Parcubacteria group bacterium GW2011_GWE2_39_37]